MKTSKYLNKNFGNWYCTYVGIDTVQGAKAKYPGHRSYFYIFERRTSDDKADKIIRLNSKEAAQVYQGIRCVEEVLNKRTTRKATKYTRKVTYCFN